MLETERERWLKTYQTKSADDFLLFVYGLTIDATTGPKLFSRAMADFQKECFQAVAPSLEAVRQGVMPPIRRFWIERTKKGGKDSDLATCVLWLLAFPQRPLYIQIGAADRDQAGIIRKRMGALLHWNPWLEERMEMAQYHCRSGCGLVELDIMAADIASAHGGTPDVLIVNELSHVTKWEFAENLLDNADGVPQGLVMIATNAGYIGTKAHRWKLNADESDDWLCMRLTEPAPWIGKKDVEDARRRNSPSRFQRLWQGRWVSGKGDAFSEDLIRSAFTRTEPDLEKRQGWRYVAGLDLGVSHDHSGLVVLGVDPQGMKVRGCWWKKWEPTEQHEVNLMEVEEALVWAQERWKLEWVGYDPNQAKLMAQRLRKKGLLMKEVPFVGNKLDEMANTLKEALEARKLELYDDQKGTLHHDFGKLNLVEKSYGYRLEAVSDETGHADVATALIIALPRAVGMLHRPGLREDDVLGDAGKLTNEDIEAMPEELREIYDLKPTTRRRGSRLLHRDEDD